MRRFLILGSLSILMIGCATTQGTNYVPEVKQISEPEIGAINTAFIGDKLLTQGYSKEQMAIYFPSTQKLGLGFTVQQGYFPKTKESAEYEFFGHSNDVGGGKLLDLLNMPVLQSPLMALKKADNAICTINAFGTPVNCKEGINFSKRNWLTANASTFQQTLIYNGKVGNKINIAYREFSSDMARPAFNNNVEYDLSESKQIGYKGALIEVIEANNQQIKYKVIRNFNK